MKQKFSLIVISLIMMLSIIVPAALFLEHYTEREILDFERSELEHVAAAVPYALQTAPANISPEERSALLRRDISGLASALAARITLVTLGGKVLADSAVEAEVLESIESNADYPEIEQARTTGKGYALRYSDTGHHEVMHVTLRLVEQQSLGRFASQEQVIVRATRPLHLIEETIAGFHQQLLKVGAAITLLAIIMGAVGVFFLSRQMQSDSESLEARVEHRTEEVVMLQMLSSLLNTCASMEEASKVLTELVPKLLPQSSGGISIYKSSRNRLDLLCQWGEHFSGQSSLNPHDCWALRKGHQHKAMDRGVLLPCAHWQDETDKTHCIPLLAQGETLGVLHLDYRGCDLEQQSTHTCEAIAEQTGLTLANIQLRQQLREQARRDPMTGLYNRLYLGEFMDDFFYGDGNNSKQRAPCAVLMLDADHFKQFNDSYGHDAGDMVLKEISNEVRRATPSTGLACRYGGEEFCVFVANIDKASAEALGNQMRSAISSLNLNINNLPLGNVTVSIGVACGPEHGYEGSTLISLADEALYAAKKAGRDQVKLYQAAKIAPKPHIKKAS